jgi:hypothetical protein
VLTDVREEGTGSNFGEDDAGGGVQERPVPKAMAVRWCFPGDGERLKTLGSMSQSHWWR